MVEREAVSQSHSCLDDAVHLASHTAVWRCNNLSYLISTTSSWAFLPTCRRNNDGYPSEVVNKLRWDALVAESATASWESPRESYLVQPFLKRTEKSGMEGL